MITLYVNKFIQKEEEASLNVTNEERERIKELENERSLAFDRFYRFGRGAEPSIVLDDFLFLGNIQHAENHGLLEQFEISMLFILKISLINFYFRTYYKCM